MNNFKSIIKQVVILVYNVLYYLIPLNKKTIVFESSVGRNYTGNPKAIYEEMIKQGLDQLYNCIWICENMNQTIPGNCKKVKRLRFKYFYYMISSKFWIMDSRQPTYLKKKEGNIYIQTWHGTPLKKLALDMSFVNMGGHRDILEYRNTFKKNSSRWDYLISQNSYSTEIFRRAFAFSKEMLEIGYPRNDILFNKDENYLNKIKSGLDIPNGYKVILYAPTWRDNQYDKDGNYKFIMPIDLQKVIDSLGDESILLLKPHYLIADKIDASSYEKNVRICGIQQDIQDLYLVSDILITDYSSVMFDYSILKRPIIFFMYDFEEYQNEMREFYFDILEEAPGRIVLNNDELINAIKSVDVDFKGYNNKYKLFCEKYNSKDVGDASRKIIEIIKRGK